MEVELTYNLVVGKENHRIIFQKTFFRKNSEAFVLDFAKARLYFPVGYSCCLWMDNTSLVFFKKNVEKGHSHAHLFPFFLF